MSARGDGEHVKPRIVRAGRVAVPTKPRGLVQSLQVAVALQRWSRSGEQPSARLLIALHAAKVRLLFLFFTIARRPVHLERAPMRALREIDRPLTTGTLLALKKGKV